MSKGNILIVEDSFIVAYHLQKTLENEGYTVMGKCESAEDALNSIMSNQPDLVLMDIMLNGVMDGVELAGLLNDKFNIPVIYISALTDQQTIGRAKMTAPYAFLTKPFDDHQIFTAIEMSLHKHNLELKLRASEQKYFSTLKSINDCVIVIDDGLNIIYANPSVLKVVQLSFSDIVGKSILEILILKHTGQECHFLNPLQCELGKANLSAMRDEIVLVRKDGIEIPIGESSLSLLNDATDNPSGLVIVFREIREKLEYQKLIKNLEGQRLALLIEGQEKERSRIAKDLHDGLGQILNAIKMNASVIAGDEERDQVFYNLIDEAIHECVRISENLLPAKLKDFKLSMCLQSLCRQVDRGGSCRVQFIGKDTENDPSQSIKVNLYRIAQEAINNAVKHAISRNINVELQVEGDILCLAIVDDGKGFSMPNTQDLYKHNGLVNIRDRAEMMGGKLKLNSGVDGTSIRVEVPLVNC